MPEPTHASERAAATRRALVGSARDLFTERGFAAVGTEEIVGRAGLTRGALYHHFADKRDLFRAVHDEMEAEIVERIGGRITGITDSAEVLRVGTLAFLDACTDPAHARVNLLEAPIVLGWDEWREIDNRHGAGLVSAALAAAMDAGVIPEQPVEPLGLLLLGALREAALLIAHAPDPTAARRSVEKPLLALVDGLCIGGEDTHG